MTIPINAILLSERLSSGARGGPMFAKTVLVSTTGHAYINERYTRPIWKYTVEFSEVLDSDAMLVRDLWMATRGGAEGFLFKDPRDYTATAQPTSGASCIGATRSAASASIARSRAPWLATRRAAAARPGPARS